jgi:hypothetical protein
LILLSTVSYRYMYIFWTICSIPLIYASVFVWISCFIFLLCLCSIIQSQILYFQNNLFLQDILTNSDGFYLHMCFMIEFSLSRTDHFWQTQKLPRPTSWSTCLCPHQSWSPTLGGFILLLAPPWSRQTVATRIHCTELAQSLQSPSFLMPSRLWPSLWHWPVGLSKTWVWGQVW